MTIIQKLWFFSGGVLANLALVGGISYYGSNQLMGQLTKVTDVQLPAVRNMTLVDMMHDGLRAVALDAIVSAEEKQTDRLAEIQKENTEKADSLRAYISALEKLPIHSDTLAAIQSSKTDLNSYIEATAGIVQLAAANDIQGAKSKLPSFNEAFTKLEDRLETIGNLIETDAREDKDQGKNALIFNITATLLGLVIGISSSFYLVRNLTSVLKEITQRLASVGQEIDGAGQQLLSASSSLSSGSTVLASSVEETSASLTEVNSTVERNTKGAGEAARESDECKRLAENGVHELEHLIKTMDEISSCSKKIQDITEVIDDIAFQTNLLALNAAVEAARAGEQGKGFAVVAEAVRALAQRSGNAAKDIGVIIRESSNKVEEGTTAAGVSGKSLEKIVASIKSLSQISHTISAESNEQSQGLKQIEAAVRQLNQVAQTNAAASEEVSVSADEFRSQSYQLHHLVKELEALVTGETSRPVKNPPTLNQDGPSSFSRAA